MTDQYPAAPPPPPSNGKAELAAAKAYAKAQRPWYKKKRWVGTIIIVAIIVIVSVSGGGGSGGSGDDDSVKASTSDGTAVKSDDGGAKVGTSKNPAPRGTAVENKSAKYQIDSVKTQDSLGDFADKPAGTYVILTLTVKNVKDETIQISSGDFTLEVAGVSIDASDEAYSLDDAFSYDDLSPGLTRTGSVVFDVAKENAGDGVLKAQAQLSSDDAVYLSLKKK